MRVSFLTRIWISLLLSALLSFAAKCYSCSSAQLPLRWPKDKSNRLLYLNEFPFFSNESCDQMRDALPVVDCTGSVCIKAVIKEPPAKREVCLEAGAIVRDCWSRVMKQSEEHFTLLPYTKNNQIRLIPSLEENVKPEGIIYTCDGFLCNSGALLHPAMSFSFLISLIICSRE